jgi:hypothetical protein
MTYFDSGYDDGYGDEFSPEDHSFDPDMQNPGYSELLEGFHEYCVEYLGATVDIDPDEDPRSQIFQKAIYAVTPNAVATGRIGRYSAVLSDGRTDINGDPLLQLLYNTEQVANRSVVSLGLLNYFMPTTADTMGFETKNLEVVSGRVALAAEFEEQHSRRPIILLFADEEGFASLLSTLPEWQKKISENVSEHTPFLPKHATPSTVVELMLQRALGANQAAFQERIQDNPVAVMEEQEKYGEFVFLGIRGITPLSDQNEFELSIVGSRIKQNENSLFVPDFSGLIEQRHPIQIDRDLPTGLVGAYPIEPFREAPVSIE